MEVAPDLLRDLEGAHTFAVAPFRTDTFAAGGIKRVSLIALIACLPAQASSFTDKVRTATPLHPESAPATTDHRLPRVILREKSF
jgi:hypothetical protein